MKPVSAPVAVVTGASAGIGKSAARQLAERGWRIIALGRDPERCSAASLELRKATRSGVPLDLLQADLSSLADTARVAERIADLTPRVDVLINNAGGVRDRRSLSADGYEQTFASNHLGPFLLTLRLLPLLRAATADSEPGRVRILATSSSGHRSCGGLDFDDLQTEREFTPGHAYTRAKLANVLFTRQLSKRLAADGIVAHAMEPGIVLESNFVSHADAGMQAYMGTLGDVAISADEAAETLVWMATDPAPGRSTNGYFHRCAPAEVSAAGQDDAASARLWASSLTLIQAAGFSV